LRDRVRRAGCLNLTLRLASGLRIRGLLILHTREVRRSSPARSLAAVDLDVAGPVGPYACGIHLGQRAGPLAAVRVDEAFPMRPPCGRALQVEISRTKDDAVALDVGDRVALGCACGTRAGASRSAAGAVSATAAAVGAIKATRVRRVEVTWLLRWASSGSELRSSVIDAARSFYPSASERVGAGLERHASGS
jgi:hypothetical protein